MTPARTPLLQRLRAADARPPPPCAPSPHPRHRRALRVLRSPALHHRICATAALLAPCRPASRRRAAEGRPPRGLRRSGRWRSGGDEACRHPTRSPGANAATTTAAPHPAARARAASRLRASVTTATSPPLHRRPRHRPKHHRRRARSTTADEPEAPPPTSPKHHRRRARIRHRRQRIDALAGTCSRSSETGATLLDTRERRWSEYLVLVLAGPWRWPAARSVGLE
jgi:hypothetical protein